MQFALILSLAILLDEILGDPRNFPHPVIFIGRLINFLKARLFTNTHSFIRGLVVCGLTISTTGLLAWLVLYLTNCNIIAQVYLLYSALAWRDLRDETGPILSSLIHDDLTSARKFLSYVVGRDTETLNSQEIASATIETIAENSVDGVMSVMFFAFVGYAINHDYGMAVCVWIFKAASTLDSMIGYENYHEFGKTSAKLDDALNFLPARLGGLIIVFASGNFSRAFRVFLNDRFKHKSPNSAHGESAFAGGLNVRLGGGAFYGGKFESRPFINENAKVPEVYDIVRAWDLLNKSCALFAMVMILLAWKV